MGLFGPSKEERAANARAFAEKVVKAKPLGIAISEEGSGGILTNYVIYAFILEFQDGHRELYQGKNDDVVINAILSKVDM